MCHSLTVMSTIHTVPDRLIGTFKINKTDIWKHFFRSCITLVVFSISLFTFSYFSSLQFFSMFANILLFFNLALFSLNMYPIILNNYYVSISGSGLIATYTHRFNSCRCLWDALMAFKKLYMYNHIIKWKTITSYLVSIWFI